MDEVKVSEAVTIAIRHIGIGSSSSGKVYAYLQQKGFNSATCQLAIAELKDRGYIDDYKAGMKIVRTRTGTKQESKQLISQRLIAGGISRDALPDILADLESDKDTCLSLLKASYPVLPECDEPMDLIQDIVKLANKRGYSSEVASSAFRVWLKEIE